MEEIEETEDDVSSATEHGSCSSSPPLPPPPPTTTTDVGSLPPYQSPRSGASKKRKRNAEVDPVDTALLETLNELRHETQQSNNMFSTFTAYLNTFLQDLPPADAKKLVKEIQQLMLTYS